MTVPDRLTVLWAQSTVMVAVVASALMVVVVCPVKVVGYEVSLP